MPEIALVTRAELFKIVRRPALWVLLAASIVLGLVFSYLIPFVSYLNGTGLDAGKTRADLLDSTLPAQVIGNTISGLPVFVGALALAAGALVVGGEFGWGTYKTLLTQRPARAVVLAGQLTAIAIAAAAAIVAQMGCGAVVSTVIALGESKSAAFPSALALLDGLATGWLILAMFMLIGAAVAMVVRGLALSIGLGVVWVLGVENIISGVSSTASWLRPIRDVLPGVNAGSLVTAVMPARVLDPPPGVNASVGEVRSLLSVVCYVAAAALLTVVLARRRDVT